MVMLELDWSKLFCCLWLARFFFFKWLRLDNSTGLSKIPFIITNKIKAVQHFQSITLLNLCLIVCPCTQKEMSV